MFQAAHRGQLWSMKYNQKGRLDTIKALVAHSTRHMSVPNLTSPIVVLTPGTSSSCGTSRMASALSTLVRGTISSTVHESKVHRMATKVKEAYPLYDMLNRDAHAEYFVGGTIYQAFLSPTDYHRWHAPNSDQW